MTAVNPGPASQSTGNVAGGPYAAWSGTNTSQVIGPAGVLVNLGGGVGGGVALYDGANSITSGTAQFSNSHGVSFGFNGQTVTASVAAATQSVQTQASGAIAGSGLTTTTTGGTALVGTNNSAGLSLAVPVYITTYAVGSQTGISSIGDSANTQTVGMLSFANSNGITFGISTGALTATITASAATAAPGISSIADGAGTQTVGMLSFANANGVTFGLSTGANTATVTASVNFAGLLSNIKISGGASSANVSAVTFSNLNGVTFGYDKTNVTASVNTVYAGTNTTFAGANISGSITQNTAGLNLSLSAAAPDGTGTTFAGTNVSGSLTLNTAGLNLALSAAAPSGAVLSRWIFPYDGQTIGAAYSNATASFVYVPALIAVTATRLDALVAVVATSSATLATMGIAMSQYAAIYTLNVSTLSSLSSGSTQATYSFVSNIAGNTEFFTNAMRPISVPMNINMTPGEYYVGFNLITHTSSIGLTTTSLGFGISMIAGGSTQTVSNYAEMGAQTASSVNLQNGMGLQSVATTGIPGAIAISDINATGAFLSRANLQLVFRNY